MQMSDSEMEVPMQVPAHTLTAQSDDGGVANSSLRLLQALSERVAAIAAACRDGYEASAAYEQLYRLSDGELDRRGLSRDTLNKHIREIATGGRR